MIVQGSRAVLVSSVLESWVTRTTYSSPGKVATIGLLLNIICGLLRVRWCAARLRADMGHTLHCVLIDGI